VSDSTRRSSLRSAGVSSCVLPPTLSSCGDRTFAAAGPRLWNSLPVQLRNPDITYGLFRRQLNGHLSREAWTRRSVTSDMRRHRKTLAYLLSLVRHHTFLSARRCDSAVIWHTAVSRKKNHVLGQKQWTRQRGNYLIVSLHQRSTPVSCYAV